MIVGLVTLHGFASAGSVLAQPTDFYACTSSREPPCSNAIGGVVKTACDRLFTEFLGAVSWFQLRCVGPIVIAVETVAIPTTQYPIYVEVVPRVEPPLPCVNDPGFVVFTAYGVGHLCGGLGNQFAHRYHPVRSYRIPLHDSPPLFHE
jgi:hypothetical protein